MKSSPYLQVNSVENSYLLEDSMPSNNVNEQLHLDLSPEEQPKNIKNYNFLNSFWKRLVYKPQCFPQKQNACIGSILEEETGISASGSIRSVLSEKLELPMNSSELSKATEESIKIFHEDYPCDFILEYNGERLGLMMLDKCCDSQNEVQLIYKFNPHLKSFHGLF